MTNDALDLVRRRLGEAPAGTTVPPIPLPVLPDYPPKLRSAVELVNVRLAELAAESDRRKADR